jgi:hypothetical protein
MATHQASNQAAIRLNRPATAVGTGHRSESHQRVPGSWQPQGRRERAHGAQDGDGAGPAGCSHPNPPGIRAQLLQPIYLDVTQAG